MWESERFDPAARQLGFTEDADRCRAMAGTVEKSCYRNHGPERMSISKSIYRTTNNVAAEPWNVLQLEHGKGR